MATLVERIRIVIDRVTTIADSVTEGGVVWLAAVDSIEELTDIVAEVEDLEAAAIGVREGATAT